MKLWSHPVHSRLKLNKSIWFSSFGAVSCAFACIGLLSACSGLSLDNASNTNSESRLQTDLGLTGNARVQRQFEAYRSASQAGCNVGGAKSNRLLITGFGPFNRKKNISGAVIDVLQKASLWAPSMSWPQDGVFVAPEFETEDNPGSLGATAVQRTLQFDGTEYEVCLLKLTVEWDYAAAVILHEAEKFQADFILMTGYGTNLTGVRLEAGALNQTRSLAGYDPKGRYLGELNTPLSSWILPRDLKLPEKLKMNWDPSSIAQRNNQRLIQASESIGRTESTSAWKFVPMRDADGENNYICNNVSYAVLAGISSDLIPLAGGRLVLKPRFAKQPSAAFLHYPYESDSSSAEEVWSWAHVIMSVGTSALLEKNQSPRLSQTSQN